MHIERDYDVVVYFAGHTVLTVKASNPDEAKDKAKELWAGGESGDFVLYGREGVMVEMA